MPLAADGAVTLWFSELVVVDAIDARLTATDEDGDPVPVLPISAQEPAYTVALRGLWPLGKHVTISLAGGGLDQAGIAGTSGATQIFPVVDDPGDLDAAGNAGFETGDLSGYTASGAAQVVSGYLGVTPTEGQSMAMLGSGAPGCHTPEEESLTSRFVVVPGVTQLVFDFDLVEAPMPVVTAHDPLITVSLRTPDGFRTVRRP